MTRRLVRVIALAALALAVVVFLVRVRSVLTPFVLAVIFAYLLAPAVNYLERRRFSRALAIALVYLVVLTAIGSFFVYLIPALVTELNRLADNLPTYVAQVQSLTVQFQQRYRHAALPDSVRQIIDETVNSIGAGLLAVVRRAAQGALGIVTKLVDVVLAPVLAVYFLIDWDQLGRRIVAALPSRQRPAILAALADADRMLGGYVRSEIIVAAMVGLLSGTAMFLLGLRFAVVFGVISALGELIPYFGPVLAAVPPVAVALLRSPTLALKVLIAYIVIQQLESNVIGPKIVGDHVGMHPLIIIFSLLAGGLIAGIPGMLLAVPVAGVIKIVGSHLARHWMEGGPDPIIPEPARRPEE